MTSLVNFFFLFQWHTKCFIYFWSRIAKRRNIDFIRYSLHFFFSIKNWLFVALLSWLYHSIWKIKENNRSWVSFFNIKKTQHKYNYHQQKKEDIAVAKNVKQLFIYFSQKVWENSSKIARRVLFHLNKFVTWSYVDCRITTSKKFDKRWLNHRVYSKPIIHGRTSSLCTFFFCYRQLR